MIEVGIVLKKQDPNLVMFMLQHKNNIAYGINISKMLISQGKFQSSFILKQGLMIGISIRFNDNQYRGEIQIQKIKDTINEILNILKLCPFYYVQFIKHDDKVHTFAEGIIPLQSLQVLSRVSSSLSNFHVSHGHEKLILAVTQLLNLNKIAATLKKFKIEDGDVNKALRRCCAFEIGTKHDILTLLCTGRADIHSRDSNSEKNFSSLDLAINSGRKEIVVFLLQLRAKLGATNEKGISAFSRLESSKKLKSLIFMNREEFYKNLYLKHRFSKPTPQKIIDILFYAINTIAITSENDRRRLSYILEHGCQFVITDIRKTKDAIQMEYKHNNEILVYAESINYKNFSVFCRVLSHEVEHAYKANLHTNIKITKPLKSVTYSKVPFCNYNYNEILLYGAYIYAGEMRVISLFKLLNNYISGNNLTPTELSTLKTQLNAIVTHQPKCYNDIVDDSSLTSTDILKKPYNSSSSIFFWKHDMKRLEHEKENKVLMSGYFAKNVRNPVEAIIAFLYETINAPAGRMGYDNRSPRDYIAESSAQVFGELTDKILKTFYPELLKHDQDELELAKPPALNKPPVVNKTLPMQQSGVFGIL
jgi:hypothetical protein